jgi:hypothetical protein
MFLGAIMLTLSAESGEFAEACSVSVSELAACRTIVQTASGQSTKNSGDVKDYSASSAVMALVRTS